MTEQVFVARERELAQLGGFLNQALASHGQASSRGSARGVCFVTGEAGAGKPVLSVAEVTRPAHRIRPPRAGGIVVIQAKYVYDQLERRPATAVNRPVFGHIVFAAGDVHAAREVATRLVQAGIAHLTATMRGGTENHGN